jgi:RloB-like protein
MKRNKLYTRREPNKEGKLYFIFCEGEKRETTYFYFFNRIASQIIIQIVPIEDGKNSPMGLYNNACQNLIKSEENPNPSYLLSEVDEVWFIIDTDKWGKEVDTLRDNTTKQQNWFVAQSNPSFEVWLYYHFQKTKPQEAVENWKGFLNQAIKGGFNSNKHPMYVETAITNSEANFTSINGQPDLATTELFVLAKKILPLVKTDIDLILLNEVEQ